MGASEVSRILAPYRADIDDLDDRIVTLLARRFEIIRDVADIKAARGIPSVLQDRVEEVLDRTARTAQARGLDPALVRAVYALLIDYAHRIEDSAKARAVSSAKGEGGRV